MAEVEKVVRGRVVVQGEVIDRGWLAIAEGKIAAIGTGDAPTANDLHDVGDA